MAACEPGLGQHLGPFLDASSSNQKERPLLVAWQRPLLRAAEGWLGLGSRESLKTSLNWGISTNAQLCSTNREAKTVALGQCRSHSYEGQLLSGGDEQMFGVISAGACGREWRRECWHNHRSRALRANRDRGASIPAAPADRRDPAHPEQTQPPPRRSATRRRSCPGEAHLCRRQRGPPHRRPRPPAATAPCAGSRCATR